MKKDIKITIHINTLEELCGAIKLINKTLEEECNCTCTLDIIVNH